MGSGIIITIGLVFIVAILLMTTEAGQTILGTIIGGIAVFFGVVLALVIFCVFSFRCWMIAIGIIIIILLL